MGDPRVSGFIFLSTVSVVVVPYAKTYIQQPDAKPPYVIALTGVFVRLYGLLNSHVACTLLSAGTASCCALSLVACYVLVAAVYQHDLVRPKVKMDIYPDEHSPRRSQAVIAGVKLCSSLADVSSEP